MQICPKCSNSHEKPGKFCSRKCANSRIFSEETNNKRSSSNKIAAAKRDTILVSKAVKKGHMFQGPFCDIKMRKCSACKNEFWASRAKSHYTTCSDECFLFIKRKNRAGSKTIYNGEVYDSSWEADIAKWFDENNIEFVRPKKSIAWKDSVGKTRRYFPDFYIPKLDLYVDPKNKFCIQDQKEKLDKVSILINLVYGEVEYLKNVITNKLAT